jgi:hypothetical protein
MTESRKPTSAARKSRKISVTAHPRRTPRAVSQRTAGSRLTAMNIATSTRMRIALTE